MPVLKYERLCEFALKLWENHKDFVPTATLDFQIQRHMGLGARSIQRHRRALADMDLLKPNPERFGRWEWTENGKKEMRRYENKKTKI